MVHLAWRKRTLDWTTRVCTISYTSCIWLCWKFSGIPLSICCQDGYISLPNGRYMKFIHLHQSLYKITHFSVLKISFVQKIYLFVLSSEYFLLYFMFAWFTFVMLFGLIFVYAYLWVLVYSQFTKYGLVLIWLTMPANKFGEGVQSFHKWSFFVTKKAIKKQTGYAWNFLEPAMQVCESASIL